MEPKPRWSLGFIVAAAALLFIYGREGAIVASTFLVIGIILLFAED